ncbi:hypothetical protein BU23DRAFT_522391 [Bimuria novae-zelandiae CBS 107.79]|uniref:Rhodopsin domain-containing protein n=1 Tax=Bimuria novae-zelandiae CBS 107.79 TaxID=1447943 RepID=A0A6A5VRK7_9PLEO|nr:hypothetical protein BU23DRAFT_522391 [Bimuria novae-zelandiae CBS 107.79]
MYPPGDEQTRQNVAVGAIIVSSLLGMACVSLRVYTRAYVFRNMGNEDWTMILAAVLTMVLASLFLVSLKKYNMGFSGISLTMEKSVESAKLGLAVIAVYKTIVTLIKASILMIYLRLSVTKAFAWLCKGSIYLLFTYQAIVLIIIPLECIPLRKMWDFTGTVPGHCIDTATFYYITSAFHIIMDMWILLLPYRLIFSIPRPTREKIAVYAVFGLGAFGTLCSIIRFHFLVVALHSMDPYYDALGLHVWSMTEVNVGIICASIPTLRPLLSRAQRTRTKHALNIPEKSETPLPSPSSSKRGGLLQAKEMFITLGTLTAGTFRGTNASSVYSDEEWNDEKPPPVPPKDMRAPPRMAMPDMAYRKL